MLRSTRGFITLVGLIGFFCAASIVAVRLGSRNAPLRAAYLLTNPDGSPTRRHQRPGMVFLMVNLSAVLLAAPRLVSPDVSLLDLNALFRARRYLHETIIALPASLPPHIIAAIWQHFTALGAIRPLDKFPNAA